MAKETRRRKEVKRKWVTRIIGCCKLKVLFGHESSLYLVSSFLSLHDQVPTGFFRFLAAILCLRNVADASFPFLKLRMLRCFFSATHMEHFNVSRTNSASRSVSDFEGIRKKYPNALVGLVNPSAESEKRVLCKPP